MRLRRRKLPSRLVNCPVCGQLYVRGQERKHATARTLGGVIHRRRLAKLTRR